MVNDFFGSQTDRIAGTPGRITPRPAARFEARRGAPVPAGEGALADEGQLTDVGQFPGEVPLPAQEDRVDLPAADPGTGTVDAMTTFPPTSRGGPPPARRAAPEPWMSGEPRAASSDSSAAASNTSVDDVPVAHGEPATPPTPSGAATPGLPADPVRPGRPPSVPEEPDEWTEALVADGTAVERGVDRPGPRTPPDPRARTRDGDSAVSRDPTGPPSRGPDQAAGAPILLKGANAAPLAERSPRTRPPSGQASADGGAEASVRPGERRGADEVGPEAVLARSHRDDGEQPLADPETTSRRAPRSAVGGRPTAEPSSGGPALVSASPAPATGAAAAGPSPGQGPAERVLLPGRNRTGWRAAPGQGTSTPAVEGSSSEPGVPGPPPGFAVPSTTPPSPAPDAAPPARGDERRHLVPPPGDGLRSVTMGETAVLGRSGSRGLQARARTALEPGSRPGAAHASPDAGPTIEVTIGRIEIRGAAPVPPPAPRNPVSRPGLLTLTEYLERHRGGS